MDKNFYITTTLPYVNAPLHMGHALEFVRADTIARYKKLSGFDVYFNTGTDEHGIKIYEKAQEKGISAQEFVDQGFTTFKEQLKMFGVDESIIHYIRTTDDNHEASASEFWKRVQDNGFIYKKNYEAKYCIGCESEKTDSELNENGHCPEHPGIELKLISEENYFFKYSAFQEKLLEFYDKNPNFIIPEFRFNEIKAFVANGLQDFSISRKKEKMPWGIPVPGDDEQVMYVWFDALTNYINTLGWPKEGGNFDKYWVNGTPTQYCGKDNTRFQGAMWQAMLMAANVPNSHQIVVNGFITGDSGIRMSKTLGNVVDPRDIVQEYGTDALRYFLLREISNFEDSPFTIERFKDAYNSGLANGVGNLFSRIKKMADTFDIVPIRASYESKRYDEYLSADEKKSFDEFRISDVINSIWRDIKELDTFIAEKKPYNTKSTEDIKYCLEKLKIIGVKLYPFMPKTSETITNNITNRISPSFTEDVMLFPRKK